MAAYISSCPSCRHTLEVTELSCPHCHVQIRGRFQGHPGLSLTEEQLSFLRLFVQSRGNLREIERILGVSYPTVRNKLDDLVEAFENTPDLKAEIGTNSQSPARARGRRGILEDVAQGRIALQDALDLLNPTRSPGEEEENRD